MLLKLTLLAVCLLRPAMAAKYACDHEIYCQGKMLHTIQMAEISKDSKDFVDMSMKEDIKTINEAFDKLMDETDNNPGKEQIQQFVDTYFTNGNELEDWTPTDFNSNPSFLKKIVNKDIRAFAAYLVSIWPKLGRKIKPEVGQNQMHYSIINVPNGFIIPGGRFREFYYWDTYWIIRGLLISEMFDTARGMLDNFKAVIKQVGFIPNGGRVYYLRRSQPPLFVPMVAEYMKKSNKTDDIDWLERNIFYLDREMNYWIDNKMVSIEKECINYKLARYMPESTGPRPESYREDYRTASGFAEEERDRIYTDIQGAAESGWDFSTRWFYDTNGGTKANLSSIQTRRTIPVDLNSFLYRAFNDLSNLYSLLNIPERQAHWAEKAAEMKAAIEEIFWNDEDGIWYDYDLDLKRHRKYFSVSNVAPLWAKAFDMKNNEKISTSIINYLKRNKIFSYRGGIPATLDQSGEQWDFPNAWPPLQAIMVQGLQNLGTKEALNKAHDLAINWINANYHGHERTNEMFEKYDAVTVGGYGGGGEYNVQTGFGWTNGVALELIEEYFAKNNS